MLETITPPIDVPRANLDPITTLSEKLAVFSLALMRPLRHETIVLCCDSSQRGVGIFAFDTKLKLTKIIDRIIGSAIKIESIATISSVRAAFSKCLSYRSHIIFHFILICFEGTTYYIMRLKSFYYICFFLSIQLSLNY